MTRGMTNVRSLQALALILAMTGASGCHESPSSQPAPTPETAPAGETAAVKAPTPPAPTPNTARGLMAEHFTKATEARTALIAGDMEGAGAAMAWLSTNELGQDSLPVELRPHLLHVRQEAGRFAAASTFSVAGESFAAMLTHCGDCHSEAHMVPRFPDVPEPTGNELRDRMRKHAWAAELFWEGLITHDQARFDRAAHALADVAVQAGELPTNTNDPVRVQAVADNVRALAAASLAAPDWAGRATYYGKFLATCATCHRMMAVSDKVRAGLEQQPPAVPQPPAAAPPAAAAPAAAQP